MRDDGEVETALGLLDCSFVELPSAALGFAAEVKKRGKRLNDLFSWMYSDYYRTYLNSSTLIDNS